MPVIFVSNQFSYVFCDLYTCMGCSCTLLTVVWDSFDCSFSEIWRWFVALLRQTHQTVFSLAATTGSVPGAGPTWYQQTFNHRHAKIKTHQQTQKAVIRPHKRRCASECVYERISSRMWAFEQEWLKLRHVLTSEKPSFHLVSHLIVVGPMICIDSVQSGSSLVSENWLWCG